MEGLHRINLGGAAGWKIISEDHNHQQQPNYARAPSPVSQSSPRKGTVSRESAAARTCPVQQGLPNVPPLRDRRP